MPATGMMRNDLTVRPMTTADIPAVLAIEGRCFPDPWSEGIFRSALEDELCLWLAVELDGALVGYAGMQAVLDEGYIDNVAVDPDFRRRGAASRLRLSTTAPSSAATALRKSASGARARPGTI